MPRRAPRAPRMLSCAQRPVHAWTIHMILRMQSSSTRRWPVRLLRTKPDSNAQRRPDPNPIRRLSEIIRRCASPRLLVVEHIRRANAPAVRRSAPTALPSPQTTHALTPGGAARSCASWTTLRTLRSRTGTRSWTSAPSTTSRCPSATACAPAASLVRLFGAQQCAALVSGARPPACLPASCRTRSRREALHMLRRHRLKQADMPSGCGGWQHHRLVA